MWQNDRNDKFAPVKQKGILDPIYNVGDAAGGEKSAENPSKREAGAGGVVGDSGLSKLRGQHKSPKRQK